MTYHTNHSWCNESNWDNKTIFGEVMVYFGDILTKTDILDNNKREYVKCTH